MGAIVRTKRGKWIWKDKAFPLCRVVLGRTRLRLCGEQPFHRGFCRHHWRKRI